MDAAGIDAVEKGFQRQRLLALAGGDSDAPPEPAPHDEEHRGGDDQRDPAAIEELQHVGREQRSVDYDEQAEHRDRELPHGHFQARTASANTSTLVTSIVPVTAMP